MRNTIAQFLTKIGAGNDREALIPVLQAIAAQVNTQALNTAGLVISGAGAATAKIGATDFYATVRGALVKIAAGTAMPVLTGLTITANRFNVACFFVDASGTTSVLFGTEGAAIGTVKWPDFPIDKALIGFLLITHSSTFTGNTTPLDTATTVYVSPLGAVDPTILYS
jgi:hypothetical protein